MAICLSIFFVLILALFVVSYGEGLVVCTSLATAMLVSGEVLSKLRIRIGGFLLAGWV